MTESDNANVPVESESALPIEEAPAMDTGDRWSFENMAKLIIENTKDVIWVLDLNEQKFIYVSPAVELLRGYTPEEIIAAPLEDALTPKSGQLMQEIIEFSIPPLLERKTTSTAWYTTEMEQPCKDGTAVWTEVVTRAVFNPDTQHIEVVGVSRDISERKRLLEQLKKQTITDELTGIANRRHLVHLVESEVQRYQRYERDFCIAIVDLDYLKPINDTYGHAVGDQALCAVANALTTTSRTTDTVGRFGGDEFLVIMPETDIAGAHRQMQRALDTLELNPLVIQDTSVPISFSYGLCALSPDCLTADDLFAQTDEVLYAAKKK